MEKNSSRIKDLIVKKLRNTISPEEHSELEAWANKSPENRHFLDVTMSPEAVARKLVVFATHDTSRHERQLKKHFGFVYSKSQGAWNRLVQASAFAAATELLKRKREK